MIIGISVHKASGSSPDSLQVTSFQGLGGGGGGTQWAIHLDIGNLGAEAVNSTDGMLP